MTVIIMYSLAAQRQLIAEHVYVCVHSYSYTNERNSETVQRYNIHTIQKIKIKHKNIQ